MPTHLRSGKAPQTKAFIVAIIVVFLILTGLETIRFDPGNGFNVNEATDDEFASDALNDDFAHNAPTDRQSNITTRRSLENVPATPWEDLVCKGHWLSSLMNAKRPSEVFQSSFTISEQLKSHGWDSLSSEPLESQAKLDAKLYAPAMKALGLNMDYKSYTYPDDIHTATEARYQNILNPSEGLIIAERNFSPDFMIEEGDGRVRCRG